jgi:lysyl-tRNA synthetase class 2
MLQELSEQEELRREKLAELKKLGIDPYPAEEFKINVTAHDIKENYERDKLNYKDISIAGRIMSLRDMGKAAFAVIQDSTDRIQIYVRRDDICPNEDDKVLDRKSVV